MPSISPQRRHGKIVGYSVYLGSVGNERRARRFSERTKSALAQARQRGVRLGTKTPERQVQLMAVAYQKQRDAFVAKVTPIIADIKKSGVSTLKGIAECLTRRGIPTRNGKAVWFGSSVKAVIG